MEVCCDLEVDVNGEETFVVDKVNLNRCSLSPFHIICFYKSTILFNKLFLQFRSVLRLFILKLVYFVTFM